MKKGGLLKYFNLVEIYKVFREDHVMSFDYSENGIDLGTLQMGEKVYVAHLHCAGGTHGALTILAVAYDAPCPHNCPNLKSCKCLQQKHLNPYYLFLKILNSVLIFAHTNYTYPIMHKFLWVQKHKLHSILFHSS